VDCLHFVAPFHKDDVAHLIDFIKSPASRPLTDLRINALRYTPDCPEYFPQWYDLSMEDRAAIASALALHNATPHKV
jgi:hypothetical protein